MLAVILDGAFLCSRACVPHLARGGGGSIVNIGGETGHRGAAGRAHVVTAKAGLAGMTKALALDLAPQRITVNCVVPGRIDTVRDRSGDPAQHAHRPAVPPIGRLGTAGGSGRDGAHAVRARCPLHHRAGDPRQRRRLLAMTTLPSTELPPVTRLLADFVATHPARGWDEGVEREAHRTFLNWVGCAIGASQPSGGRRRARGRVGARTRRPGVDPGPQRARRHRECRAAERDCLAHFRLRRHPLEDDHPSRRPRRVGGAGARRAPRYAWAGVRGCHRDRDRRRVPRRQCDLSRSLRPRMAHHRLDRHAGRRRRLRAPPPPRRAADRHGARHRRVAADRRPRAVRFDDQAVSRRRRRSRGAHVGIDGATRLYRLGPRARGAPRAHADLLDQVRLVRNHRRASGNASRSPSTRTSPLPAAS